MLCVAYTYLCPFPLFVFVSVSLLFPLRISLTRLSLPSLIDQVIGGDAERGDAGAEHEQHQRRRARAAA